MTKMLLNVTIALTIVQHRIRRSCTPQRTNYHLFLYREVLFEEMGSLTATITILRDSIGGKVSLTKLLRNKHIYHHRKTIEKITTSPQKG